VKVVRIWDWTKEKALCIFPREQLARSVVVLAGGTALGQVITVLASPVLTRLYTPDDFGVLAVYASILGIVSVVAGLRYELTIPLPEKDEYAVNLLTVALCIVVLMGFFLGMVTWFFGGKIVDWTNTPELRPYIWLLPIGVVLVGTFNVLNYWALRRQSFGIIAQTKINQGLGAVFTQIGCGFVKPSPLGLMIGQLVGQTLGISTYIKVFWKQKTCLLRNVNLDNIRQLSRRYYQFPLYSSWGGVLNTLSVQIPVLILSSFFGSSITGFYMLAYRVLGLPTQLISRSVTQVLLSAGSEAVRRGNVSHLVESTFRQLVLIGLPCFGIIVLAGPEASALIFGQPWEEAGVFMQMLTPWIFLVLVASPLSAFSIVLEKQRQEAFYQSILLASRVISLLGGWIIGSSLAAIFLFSIASMLCWLGYVIWIMNLTGVSPAKMGATLLLEEGVPNLILFFPLILIKIFNPNSMYFFVATVFTFGAIAVRMFIKIRNGGVSIV